MTRTTSRYAFRNSAAQMQPLTGHLDPITFAELRDIDVQPGWRCLSLGAGAGTVTGFLADRVESTGRVTAVDLDTSMLTPRDNLDVVAHDLRTPDPLPGTAPFHLIEARLLTQHLPNREELVDQLTRVLAPGGWILLGEFVDPRPRVLTAATDADGALVTRVIDALLDVLLTAGVDMQWGNRQHALLSAAGLECVRTRWHAEAWTGGSAAIQLLVNNTAQKREQLIAAGISTADLDRFADILQNPALTLRSYEFASTRGRRPDELTGGAGT